MFGRRGEDAVYRRSQNAPLKVGITWDHRRLAAAVLSSGDEAADRRRAGLELIAALNASAGLPECELVVADRRQVHQHNGQKLQSRTYGYYRCWFEGGKVSRSRIRIYHRTAVRQQVTTAKVFLNTLIHEWVHHYDFAGLGMARSPHTAGFYARLRTLADALQVGFVLPPEPGAVPAPPPPAQGWTAEGGLVHSPGSPT
jgi:hypothetical protein